MGVKTVVERRWSGRFGKSKNQHGKVEIHLRRSGWGCKWSLTIKAEDLEFKPTRHNVIQLINETVTPGFDLEVAKGVRARPKLVLSFSVKQPERKMAKTTVNRKVAAIFRKIGIKPCQ